MSAAMSEQQLAEIAARAEAASAGPWMADGAEIYRAPYGYVVLDLWVGETLRIDDQGASNADAEFVAHARTDVPALLARIAELEAERRYAGRLEAEICQCQPECEGGEYLHEAGCPVVSIQMQVYGPAVEGDAS